MKNNAKLSLLILRFFFVVLFASCGFCMGADFSQRGAWSATKAAPSGIFSVGWNTVVLSDGSVLGVGNAALGRRSAAFLYNEKNNEWSAAGDIPDGVVGLGTSLTLLPNGMVLSLGVDADRRSVAMLWSPVSKQWRLTGDIPSKTIGVEKRVIALTTGDFLVLGDGLHTTGLLYNYIKDTWSVTKNLPVSVSGYRYATEMKNGKIFVIAEDNSIFKRWIGVLYDPANNSWEQTGETPVSMRGSTIKSVILLNGSILIIGYQYNPIALMALVYDPEKNLWSKAGILPIDISNVITTTLLQDGFVLATAKNLMATKIIGLLFDPTNNLWTLTSPPPNELISIGRIQILQDGTIWAMGSLTYEITEALNYFPIYRTWKKVGNLPLGITHVSSSIDERGAVLLFTGQNKDSRSQIENAFLYFP